VPELPLVHVSRPPDEPTENAPAVVFLHGLGGDEENMIGVADHLPDDLHAFGVRAPFESSNGYSWVSLEGRSRGPFRKSLDQLAEFVRYLTEEDDVAPDHVGLFGFSQGAKAGLAALIDRPERYRWVVALNGYLPRSHDDPDEVANAEGNPVFVGVGENDDVIAPRYGRESAELLDEAGLDVTFRTYPVGHRMSREEFADVSEWLDSPR
jgi:phospholipase/carboxylesterase